LGGGGGLIKTRPIRLVRLAWRGVGKGRDGRDRARHAEVAELLAPGRTPGRPRWQRSTPGDRVGDA